MLYAWWNVRSSFQIMVRIYLDVSRSHFLFEANMRVRVATFTFKAIGKNVLNWILWYTRIELVTWMEFGRTFLRKLLPWWTPCHGACCWYRKQWKAFVIPTDLSKASIGAIFGYSHVFIRCCRSVHFTWWALLICTKLTPYRNIGCEWNRISISFIHTHTDSFSHK